MSVLIRARALNRGCWFEILDVDHLATSDDGTLLPSSNILRAQQMCIDMCDRFNRSLRIPLKFQDMMLQAGFKNVTRVKMQLPMNGWPKDRQLKELGIKAMPVHKQIIKDELAPTISSPDQKTVVDAVLSGCLQEMEDESIHAYMPLWVPLFSSLPTEACPVDYWSNTPRTADM